MLSQSKIELTLGKPCDLDDVCSFLMAHYLPDEPVNRSLILPGLLNGTDEQVAKIKDLLLDGWVINRLKQPYSVLARNERGQIVGSLMNGVFEKSSLSGPQPLPENLKELPKKVQQFFQVTSELEYDPARAMANIEGCKKICLIELCAIHKDYRGLGIGKRMLQRTIELASSADCTHCFAWVSGNYSQAIVGQFGFRTMKTIFYDSFKDEEGNLIVDQPREHTKSVTAFLKLQ